MGFSLTLARSHDEDKEKARKRRIISRAELSNDLIVEILPRLPVRSLLRFKCVCKFWYESIVSPDFIHKYNNNNSNITNAEKVSLYLRRNDDLIRYPSNTISFRFNDALVDTPVPIPARMVTIAGCSNGIVCLSLRDQHHQDFVLWNPATCRYQLIPRLNRELYLSSGIVSEKGRYSCGFCFDSVANTYKVARVTFCSGITQGSIAQVCMFTTNDNSWKRKILQEVPHQKCCCFITDKTSVKRSMYWMTNIHGCYCDLHPLDDAENYILCFDMVDESFKGIKLPPYRGVPCLELSVYRESLAMFVRRSSGFSPCGHEFDVWVLNDDDQAATTWSKQLTFRPPVDVPNAIGFLSRSGDDGVDWVVLRTYRRGKYYRCNPQTGEIYSLSAEDQPEEIFVYSESLAFV